MQEMFEEILTEASNGKVSIDGDIFPIAFGALIYEKETEIFNSVSNHDFPILIIRNRELFLKKLIEYVDLALQKIKKFPPFRNEGDKVKLLVTYLFANATSNDFVNPLELVNRNIAFMRDFTFDYLSNGMNVELARIDASELEIKHNMQSAFMETTNKIDFTLFRTFEANPVKYHLPAITYGIATNSLGERDCYIYSILNPKATYNTDAEQKYAKKISRELYKLNKGVMDSESDEYKAYVNGETSYEPENISLVSPSSVLSLTIFISLLESENITKISVVPNLPIRFLSRTISTIPKTPEIEEQIMQMNKNIVDKFIRTFRRVAFHLGCLEFTAFPYELDEYMHISLDFSKKSINNQILDEVYNKCSENAKKHVK